MSPQVVTVTLNPALDKTVTVEQLAIGGLNRVQTVRLDPGGKGINVAKVLKQFAVHDTFKTMLADLLDQTASGTELYLW